MWKNIVEAERPHVTIWRMHISRWVLKGYKNTIRMFNTCSFSTATKVAWTRLSITLYVCCLCCDLQEYV